MNKSFMPNYQTNNDFALQKLTLQVPLNMKEAMNKIAVLVESKSGL